MCPIGVGLHHTESFIRLLHDTGVTAMAGYLCRNARVARFFIGKEMRELAGSIQAMIGRRQRAHSTFLSVLQRACSTPPLFLRRMPKKQRFPTAAGRFLAANAHGAQVFSCQHKARGNSGILTAAGLCAQGVLAAHAGFPDAFAFIGWRWASVSPRAQQKDACVYKRLFRLTRCFF